jgi:hypothetical protein
MDFEQIIRIPNLPMKVKADVREVVHDVANKPHVLLRVRLTGWHFPERAPEPFLVIGKIVSSFVRIGPEGTYADAYFDVRPPKARRVSFGYGNTISWDFDVVVDPERSPPLDRKRLPKGVVQVRNLSRAKKRR